MPRVKIPVSFSYTTNPAGSTPTYVSTSSGSYVSQAADLTQPVQNTVVTVTARSTGSPVTVYQTETSGATYTTLATDASGNVPGWVNEGSYNVTAAAKGAFAGATYPFDAVRGDGVSNIAAGAVNLAALTAAIQQALAQPGMISDYGGAIAPAGYVLCDGSVYATGATGSTYNALSQALGTRWNTGGEGSGNFRVPDLRGLTIVGAGNGIGLTARTAGTVGGEETHLLTSAETGQAATSTGIETASHTHSTNDGVGGQVVVPSGSATGAGLPATGIVAVAFEVLNAETANHNHNIAAANATSAHNNMQPFAAATKIIKL